MHRAPDLREDQDLIASALRRFTSTTPLRHADPIRHGATSPLPFGQDAARRMRADRTIIVSHAELCLIVRETHARLFPDSYSGTSNSTSHLCRISVLRSFGYLSAFSFYVQRLRIAFSESAIRNVHPVESSWGWDPSHSSASHGISTAGQRQMAQSQSLGLRMSRDPPAHLWYRTTSRWDRAAS
jgi:hypothetical protein